MHRPRHSKRWSEVMPAVQCNKAQLLDDLLRPRQVPLKLGQSDTSIGYTTMYPTQKMAVPTSPTSESDTKVSVVELRNENQHEVLSFLFTRPVHTVCMVSYIRDNGIESPLNRGTFYGYRNEDGRLEGLALIGHATLVETQNDEALKAFAEINRQYPDSHL